MKNCRMQILGRLLKFKAIHLEFSGAILISIVYQKKPLEFQLLINSIQFRLLDSEMPLFRKPSFRQKNVDILNKIAWYLVKLFSTIYENAQKANSENREVYINKTLILFNNMRNVENDRNAIFYLQNKMCFRDTVYKPPRRKVKGMLKYLF